ncbi:MAG: prephenate dehydrogenase/arogenate dehydrogenase family protein [Pseudomonadales bacterium]
MRLAVVGTGLIGGSFALAARAAGVFDEVVGVEPDAGRRRAAEANGLIDRAAGTVPADADAVLLAGPSHTVAEWVVRLADHPAIVLDTASVKQGVLAQVRAGLGHLPARFVPCHPMAGSDRSGPDAANAELFQGAEIIVTPGEETDPAAAEQAAGWWRAVGGRVTYMDAQHHDEIVAVTSHLPHLVAFSYLQQVDGEHLEHTAGGFRDFTRIGGADADMWLPIFRLNRAAVLQALDALQRDLVHARALIEQGDETGLRAFIEAAARRRRALANGH